MNPVLNYRRWNYGKSGFDRTHNVTANVIYDLPKFSKGWNNLVSRSVFDGWQVAGVALFLSGAPTGMGLSFVQAVDITGGSGVDSRVNLTGNPESSLWPTRPDALFRHERRPAAGAFGVRHW